MSTLVFTPLTVCKHDEYGRPSTELADLLAQKPTASETPERETSLTFRVKPNSDTRLKLATGESIRDLEGYITLKPGEGEKPIASADKSKNYIGLIQYFGGHQDDTIAVGANYTIEVFIPKVQFNELATSLHHGQVPPSIWVDIEGLKLPDEFSHEWDKNPSNSRTLDDA
jgi:hypothetical protein